jgi:hypothetical protein
VSSGGVLRLYVNGIKDAEAVLDDAGGSVGASATGGDLHLGRDPWRAGTHAYLDDFRWYDRAFSGSEIRALTYPSLDGMGADFVSLGCMKCRFPEAVRRCEQGGGCHGGEGGAHLCSAQELLSGGLHTARAMGWLSASPEVWFEGETEGGSFSDAMKLGLCCTD